MNPQTPTAKSRWSKLASTVATAGRWRTLTPGVTPMGMPGVSMPPIEAVRSFRASEEFQLGHARSPRRHRITGLLAPEPDSATGSLASPFSSTSASPRVGSPRVGSPLSARRHPLDAPDSKLARRVKGEPTGNNQTAAWEMLGGFTREKFNERPRTTGSFRSRAAIPPDQRAKHTDCSAWPAAAVGDQRLRQLRWLSSASVDGSRRVERSAHELSLLSQRRVVRLVSHTNLSSEQIRLATDVAQEALNNGIVCEFAIGAQLELNFNAAYGPEKGWRCFVGRSCEYVRAHVHGRSPMHVHFHVGLLPFLLFKRPLNSAERGP